MSIDIDGNAMPDWAQRQPEQPREISWLGPEVPDPDGGYDPDALPKGWPTHGWLYGQRIPLRGIETRLRIFDRKNIVVPYTPEVPYAHMPWKTMWDPETEQC